jgi:hypothetical protein
MEEPLFTYGSTFERMGVTGRQIVFGDGPEAEELAVLRVRLCQRRWQMLKALMQADLGRALQKRALFEEAAREAGALLEKRNYPRNEIETFIDGCKAEAEAARREWSAWQRPEPLQETARVA